MSPRIQKLKEAIQIIHHCGSWHVASEPVLELSIGEVAWDGVVKSFRLVGHPKAQRCYAWSYEKNGETKYMTILELPPVDSAESAVKVAIAAQSK